MRVRGNQSYPSPSASWASNVKVRSTWTTSSHYFIIMKGRNQELGTGQTQRRELSVPESLRAIDRKYDEILEDFHQRRRETPTRDTEQPPCGNCQQREVSHGRENVQSHVMPWGLWCHVVIQENKCSALDSDSSVYIEKKTKRFNKSNRKRDQSNSSPEMFQNEHFDLLHKKMDDLLSSKEKDLSVIQDLKRQLAESEEKARSVREEMTQRELSLSKQKYEEKINNLQQIIEKQNESMKVGRFILNVFRILKTECLGTEQWTSETEKSNKFTRPDRESEGRPHTSQGGAGGTRHSHAGLPGVHQEQAWQYREGRAEYWGRFRRFVFSNFLPWHIENW